MADILGGFEQAMLVAFVQLGTDAYGRVIVNDVQAWLERDVSVGAALSSPLRWLRSWLPSTALIPIHVIPASGWS